MGFDSLKQKGRKPLPQIQKCVVDKGPGLAYNSSPQQLRTLITQRKRNQKCISTPVSRS